MQIHSAKLGDLYSFMAKELSGIYPEQEIKSILRIILSHFLGLSPSEIILRRDEELSESGIFMIQRAIARLKRHEPVQYITGVAHFHGFEFRVDPSVLIPRPETEELVQWVLDDHPGRQRMRILDVGTGSGCIAVTLKKKSPGLEMMAVDISEKALEVAIHNAENLNVQITFKQLDILSGEARSFLPVFDVIISNPPYVTADDRTKMLQNVTGHEPALALFVDDAMLFYREIAIFSQDHLKQGGILYFETNELYAKEVGKILEENGCCDVEIRKDMQGKERMIKGVRC